jgi:hypothetical protein
VTLLLPFDAAAPPEDVWGPVLVVGLVVVAVVAMIIGFGRITRRRRADDAARQGSDAGSDPGSGDAPSGEGTQTEDGLPTDPP